ncbi:MAG TPA: hypothetical protein VLG76_00910 [Rhabdochlamydiaceae bacterium]|nr:hypothetical protein [Rhabdochlamydiaceae bacterium]
MLSIPSSLSFSSEGGFRIVVHKPKLPFSILSIAVELCLDTKGQFIEPKRVRIVANAFGILYPWLLDRIRLIERCRNEVEWTCMTKIKRGEKITTFDVDSAINKIYSDDKEDVLSLKKVRHLLFTLEDFRKCLRLCMPSKDEIPAINRMLLKLEQIDSKNRYSENQPA